MVLPRNYRKVDVIELPPETIQTYANILFKYPCLVRGYPPQMINNGGDYHGKIIPKSCIYGLFSFRPQNNTDVIEIEDIAFGPKQLAPAIVGCQRGIIIFRRCRFLSFPDACSLEVHTVTEKDTDDTVHVILENCIIESDVIVSYGGSLTCLDCVFKGCGKIGVDVHDGGSTIINYSQFIQCPYAVVGNIRAGLVEIYENNMLKSPESAVNIRKGCQAIMKNCIVSEAAEAGVLVSERGKLHIEDSTIERCFMGLLMQTGKCLVTAINCCMQNNISYGVLIDLHSFGEIRLENCRLMENGGGNHVENNAGELCKVYSDGHIVPSNGDSTK